MFDFKRKYIQKNNSCEIIIHFLAWTYLNFPAHCVKIHFIHKVFSRDFDCFLSLKSALVTTILQRKMTIAFEIQDTVQMVSVFPCFTGQIIKNWMLSWPFPIWREILKKNIF